MRPKKKPPPKEKAKLHPRNKHRGRYDFQELIAVCPELAEFAAPNIYGEKSIDFADPKAVKILNKALLKHFYGIGFWEIPENYLCPPIPGRADYIHYVADLLESINDGKISIGKHIKCLDIGIGANCVYPIIGSREYGWSFVGSDIDKISIASAEKIIESNSFLQTAVECRLQKNPNHIFRGIIESDEFFDLSICNPPFFASPDEARQRTLKKLSNLNNKKVMKPIRNFGGQNREIWCEGGETEFVGNMIRESVEFKNSCFWFSTLISKQSNLKSVYAALKIAEAIEVKTIQMGQGNKISRIVAWTFLDEQQQENWKNKKWCKKI
jgi:23S rRNA (adenine1618-N6)-methyltransferase